VRTYNHYLVPVPRHMRVAALAREFFVRSYYSDIVATAPGACYRRSEPEEMAAAIRDINAAIGLPVVRTIDWTRCNYYASNSKADYRDLIVYINDTSYNMGRHYVSSPARVSLLRPIEHVIKHCLDRDGDDGDNDRDNNQDDDNVTAA
jgi:hypothetical protein